MRISWNFWKNHRYYFRKIFKMLFRNHPSMCGECVWWVCVWRIYAYVPICGECVCGGYMHNCICPYVWWVCVVSVCVENICICPYVWCVSGECVCVEDICNMYMSLVLSLYGEFVWWVCVVSVHCASFHFYSSSSKRHCHTTLDYFLFFF